VLGVVIAMIIVALIARLCGLEQDVQGAAQARLKALVARRAVDCAPHNRDQFIRIVAICRTSAVPGEALVREGLAVDFGGAQTAKRGLWRGTFQRPADWRQAHPRAG
jgi:endonuclease YncB( thermonuclease family)